MITHVPKMSFREKDLARRFIVFIDAVYESKVGDWIPVICLSICMIFLFFFFVMSFFVVSFLVMSRIFFSFLLYPQF